VGSAIRDAERRKSDLVVVRFGERKNAISNDSDEINGFWKAWPSFPMKSLKVLIINTSKKAR
jgi:hypothetical protein